MKLRILTSLSIIFRISIQTVGKNTPWQKVYDPESATSTVRHGGCVVTSWDGMDSDGMSGPPWVSYINCTAGSSYKTRGVAIHGDFQVWLHYGTLHLNGQTLSHMGESFWIAPGAAADLEVAGSAYVAGSKFELMPIADSVVFTSSYTGSRFRNYSYADAVAKRNSALLQHDDHICNGSSPSMDFVFGSQTKVDPPGVAVLNCAPASNPHENFVWSHFHPFGALYMPFSGEICFATTEVLCARPGVARWTSANLMYYEFFRKINETNANADAVRDIAGVPPSKCQYPNLFAVTNFDGFNPPTGVPNFDDWPVNAHKNKLAMGIGPWGVFPKMTVQATKVVVKASTAEVELESEEENAPRHASHLSLV
jgi:hypothetical protein